MRQLRPTTTLVSLLGLDIALLMLAAALTPDQNPALPIELSVLLAGLGAWVLVRRSRASSITCTIFTALMLLLTVHILVGDMGDKGPRELVPDVLLLVSFAASMIAAAATARARQALSA